MPWTLPPLRPRPEVALRDVRASRPQSRALAAEALGEAGPETRAEAIAALMPLATDGNAGVRASALASLGRLEAEEALDLLLACFQDADPTVRQVAMVAAADLGDPRALPSFLHALSAEEPEVRFQAVAAVAELSPTAVDALAGLVADPDVEVRTQLAEALGLVEDPGAAGPLGRLLEDDAAPVRFAAAVSLARRGDGAGEAILRARLDDRDTCYEAAWALGELGPRADARSREALARLASAFLKPLAAKAAASAALVRLSDPRGVEGLRAVLRAFRSDARSYAVQLVGELREGALLEEIVALVDRPRGVDPVVLARALTRFEGATSRAALTRMAEGSSEAAAVAREALG